MEQMMIAVAACFLSSTLLGLRLTLFGFVPLMLLAAIAALVLQGALAGVITLIVMQTGYMGGVMMRALVPSRPARPALRRAALR